MEHLLGMFHFDVLLVQEPGLHANRHPPQHAAWVAVHAPTSNGPLKAITYIKKELYSSLPVMVDQSLTDENMVTVSIRHFHVTNLYNRTSLPISPLQSWMDRVDAGTNPGTRIIAGDFNLHHPMWQATSEADSASNRWVDWITLNDMLLASTPDIATHERGNTIDLVFTTNNTSITNSASENIGSDHELLDWTLYRDPVEFELPPQPIAGFNYSKANWERFTNELKARCEHITPPRSMKTNGNILRSHKTADKFACTLVELLEQSLDASTPRLRITARSKRWWTPQLKAQKRRLRVTRGRAKRFPTAQNLREREDSNKEYAKAIQEAKSTTWNNWLSQLKGADIWTALKYIKPRAPVSVMPALRIDDSYAKTFPDQIDELYRSLFPHVAPSTQRAKKVTPDPRWVKIRSREIRSALREASPNKAPGPDGIKTKAITMAWKVRPFRKLLRSLLSFCLDVGYHPKCFRRGVAVILPKPRRDLTLARSYRPITLLSTLGKVLEKIVQKRLTVLTETLLPAEQYGGRHGYSAVDAVGKLCHDIEYNMKRSKVTSILAIDIQGAFDNVHRDTLLNTMQEMNLPTAVQNWVYYFMRGRRTSLVVDGKRTTERKTVTGIPQGSPISPLLFLIYTTPLYSIIKNLGGKVIGFIDDITIYVKGSRQVENTNRLSEILQKCHEWTQSAHAAIDFGDKLGFMHVSQKKVVIKRSRRLLLPGGERRQATPTLKLLGVTLDAQLKFGAHAADIIARGKKALNIVRRLGGVTRGVTGGAMRNLYKACVRTILEYAGHLWHSKITKSAVAELQRIQNAALRSILGAYQQTAIDSLHRDTELVPLVHRFGEIQEYSAVRLHRNVAKQNPYRKRKLRTNTHIHGILRQLYAYIPVHDLKLDRYRSYKPPWARPNLAKEAQAHTQKLLIRSQIHQHWQQKWEGEYRASLKGKFYRSITAPHLYSPTNRNALASFIMNSKRFELSKLVQLRTATGAIGSFFRKCNIMTRSHFCGCGADETVVHILRDCPDTEQQRTILRAVSSALDIKILLDTRAGLKAVSAFLAGLPHLLH